MSKPVLLCLCAVLALGALLEASLLRPVPAQAASGTLSTTAPLVDAPDPNASVIATLPEGAVVTIDGAPVDGFYPVTVEDLSGWMRGETLLLEKDAAADAHGSPVPETPVADAGEAEPAPGAIESPIPATDAGPLGPASVTADAPIRVGPGRDYERITTAPRGSSVEQTGHQIDGYVTVQFAEITGWILLDHLGPLSAQPEEFVTSEAPERVAKENERDKLRTKDHAEKRR